jgi:geranylgeranyl transferase type-2 subunit beta
MPAEQDTGKESDQNSIILLPNEAPFCHSKHVHYIATLPTKLDSPSSYEGAQVEHLKMSGIYWCLTALSILKSSNQVDELLGVLNGNSTSPDRPSLIDWVMLCWDERVGGFGGNIGHDAHLLYTLSAVQILAVSDKLELVDSQRVVNFVQSLQQPDGSFAGDSWGEIDTRFTYCALSTLSLLGKLGAVDIDKAADYILRCRNLDGGFGCVIGAESHAGQVFCCIGALSICRKLNALGCDGIELLSWWLAERQCDSGGLNGRPEKQADVCYSWWILSALSILGKMDWISKKRLGSFILKCQDDVDGGIADRPDDMADVFHTFFGIAGLSLLGYLHANTVDDKYPSYRRIDPVYALPTDVVQRLGLAGQVVCSKGVEFDERLSHYDTSSCEDL